ncbi:hypothetical protein BH11PLA2_BH11PLA2_20580 [soil metagenome]
MTPPPQVLPQLQPRSADGHKGTYGRVLVVAGSRGFSGAAVLTGMAALKCGAGLVAVACPETIQDTVAAGFPCYTTIGLPANEQGQLSNRTADALASIVPKWDIIAIGPGLSTSDGVALTVRSLLKQFDKPMVIDADGLNVLTPLDETLANRNAPTVLTPHPGEFARLTGSPTPISPGGRMCAAKQFATIHRCVLLLKGHRTVISDGVNTTVNATGNPGMATGGSGDVLTGVIAALMGQGLSAFDAAVLAAHVHGLAGDLAAKALGEVSLTAVDILAHLPAAIRSMSAASAVS